MPQPPAQLPFDLDEVVDPSLVTSRAGVPLAIELFRQLGVAATIDAQVAVKQRQRGLRPSQLAESLVALWLAGLGRANQRLVAGLQQGAAAATATLDVDATLLEAHKDTATVAYDGTRGHQPVVVLWAEQDVIVHDQFRDGHVPAGCGNQRVLERAVAALPAGITHVRLRGDSALYETDLLGWCEAHHVEYAISADLSEPLHAEILRLPAGAWRLEREDTDARREWAEVPYVPDDGDHRKARPCVRRYLALRITKCQGELFADGRAVLSCGPCASASRRSPPLSRRLGQ